MDWQLITEDSSKFFQFRWKDNLAFYTTKGSEKFMFKKLNPHFLKQIHSVKIIDIDYSKRSTGDGLITKKKNCTLGVKIADCLPVYLFSDKKICIIHCGWRGVINGIAREAAKVLANYRYALGASIGPCCYQVREDVAELFAQKYHNAIHLKGNNYYLDLKAALTEDLGSENLVGSLSLCTHCHPEFFYSYRRGDEKKRNYAMMVSR